MDFCSDSRSEINEMSLLELSWWQLIYTAELTLEQTLHDQGKPPSIAKNPEYVHHTVIQAETPIAKRKISPTFQLFYFISVNHKKGRDKFKDCNKSSSTCK